MIEFNDQQKQAIKEIKDWFFESGKPFFVLAGYAGTGKTTITKYLIKEFLLRNPDLRICLSAPTHKALNVIFKTVNNYFIKKNTLASLLGLRPNTNLLEFSPANARFCLQGQNTMKNYNLIIIDESSMIQTFLLETILKGIDKDKTKILFLGDPAQLPPVKEKESPVFNVNNDEIFWLTKIERQKNGSPYLEVLDFIRNNLDHLNLNAKILNTSKVNESGSFEVRRISTIKDDREMQEILSGKTKFLAYKNETVNKWNELIVEKCHFSDTLEGHLLTSYTTSSVYEGLINGLDYKVLNMFEKDIEISSELLKVLIVEIIEIDEKGEFDPKDVLSKTISLRILHPQSYSKFERIVFKLYENAISAKDGERSSKWAQYYKVKDQILLMNKLSKMSKIAKTEMIIPKDIDYAYSRTIHTSQGSTYENIILDVDDITTNFRKSEVAKLLYVGASRASKNLTFIKR